MHIRKQAGWLERWMRLVFALAQRLLTGIGAGHLPHVRLRMTNLRGFLAIVSPLRAYGLQGGVTRHAGQTARRGRGSRRQRGADIGITRKREMSRSGIIIALRGGRYLR
ncbi:hypothetical protein [Oleiagrimonas soli]|uniref:Uncharacterized protein n=1 Tax=Oleiagrimonas soli TaxID=1543381 RepID=A0A099CVN8_9GAMM|nr:hypothetical protein [Oleiagrimonas soli]KGI77682.1 hypothetical protein LF63_0110455 [Oleiagrimonas soli]MBB6182790.1 hypothetical protein [Oleiagrimonas soli]